MEAKKLKIDTPAFLLVGLVAHDLENFLDSCLDFASSLSIMML